MDMLEFEPEAFCCCAGSGQKLRVLLLRQVNEAAIVAEVAFPQLRVSIEPEGANHKALEVPGEKVGQVKRSRLRVGERIETLVAGEELVAMCTGQSLHALLLEYLVDAPAVPQSAYATKMRS